MPLSDDPFYSRLPTLSNAELFNYIHYYSHYKVDAVHAALAELRTRGLYILKGCTKTPFDPLRAASNLATKASCARESLPQLIFVALHATNLRQLLEDVPFFFVRKTLLECSLFVADTLDTGGETGR